MGKFDVNSTDETQRPLIAYVLRSAFWLLAAVCGPVKATLKGAEATQDRRFALSLASAWRCLSRRSLGTERHESSSSGREGLWMHEEEEKLKGKKEEGKKGAGARRGGGVFLVLRRVGEKGRTNTVSYPLLCPLRAA